ncbi:MAG: hypothetical protein D6801_05255, partial [Alphaproteobacteria bacterium]
LKNDDIATGYKNDVVKAGGGDDWITDFGGKDRYDGGAGQDTLAFNAVKSAKHGVVANLAKGTVKGADGKLDKVVKIENVQGTNQNDKLTGDRHGNDFWGLGGKDMINGGKGKDIVHYDHDAHFGGNRGVTVNLAKGKATDGFGKVDTLKAIEGAVGTDKADRFIDNGQSNSFKGGAGDDTFIFTKGNDHAWGGAGADTFVFSGAKFGKDVVHDFQDGQDMLKVTGATSVADLTIHAQGSDMLIDWNGNTIVLQGQAGATIDAADFIFV